MAGVDDAQLKDFQGLPIAELIVDPLVSAAKGQKKLAGVTLDFVSQIGFEPDPDDPKKTRTRTVDVEVERLIKGQTKPLKQMVSKFKFKFAGFAQAEGLARFTQMLASTLEPVDTQAK
jgi:hypothetical protein